MAGRRVRRILLECLLHTPNITKRGTRRSFCRFRQWLMKRASLRRTIMSIWRMSSAYTRRSKMSLRSLGTTLLRTNELPIAVESNLLDVHLIDWISPSPLIWSVMVLSWKKWTLLWENWRARIWQVHFANIQAWNPFKETKLASWAPWTWFKGMFNWSHSWSFQAKIGNLLTCFPHRKKTATLINFRKNCQHWDLSLLLYREKTWISAKWDLFLTDFYRHMQNLNLQNIYAKMQKSYTENLSKVQSSN